MIEALPYIPQRPPMVMVDSIVSCDPVVTRTQYRVHEDCIFLRDGMMQASGLVENIAQTCAARIGYLNSDKPVQIGVIGGIRDLRIHGLPSVGDLLETTIEVGNEVFAAVILQGKVECKGQVVAECEMKVFIVDNI